MARQRRLSAAEIAKNLNADPFKYLCQRFNSMEDGKEKDGIALELLPYCLPKLKAVEHDVAPGGAVTITLGSAPTQLGDTQSGGGGDG